MITLAALVALSAPPVATPAPTAAPTVTITFQISGLDERKGVVRCTLFDRDAGWPDDPDRAVARYTAPIEARRATCTFQVPPGRYAGAILHDVNGNERADTNLIGIPTEGFGFTAGATAGLFGAPDFDDARFTVTGPTTQRIVADYL